MAGILGASQMSATTSQGDLGSNGQQNGGGAGGTAVGSDALTNHLAGMSRHQLYEIVSQMKDLIQQNQQQARQILIANPQLTKALFQAQIMLGMVRPPQTSPLQNVASQPSQQQPAQQSQLQLVQMPPVEPPQVQNMPQLLAPQMTAQQGQPQMPTGQLQSQLPQALIPLQPHQPSQNMPFQPSVQSFQQSNARTSTMLPSSQPVQLPGLQPHNPAIQHQPPLHVHPPPLPQQPRPLPPSQLPHQNAQSISFQLPSGPHSHPPHPPFQQPSGILQTSMGLPYQQLHPPLPNQPPPPQVFQMSRGGADLGSTGIPQSSLPNSVSMGLGAISQAGRGPSMGVPSGPAPHMPWNQLLPSSGSMVGAPQGTSSMGMAVHMGPGPLLGSGNGVGSALAGGLSSNGAQPGVIRSNVTGEGPGLIYSQGYSQPLLQPPPQQQSQQVSLALEQQRALLQQVMNLTPEQINSLPPEQRQQVLELQQAFRSQSS